MPYVDRDGLGHVTATFECAQREGQEFAESAVVWVDPKLQKAALLVTAQESRETLLFRLSWQTGECTAALKAAEAIPDSAEIALQTANLAAIVTATNALVTALDDPRVVNAVNGAVKQAVKIVYAEIVLAFKNAAPGPYARIKQLDTLPS